jgi:tRNA G18 (ribose-2'-O)-methylase SpoU
MLWKRFVMSIMYHVVCSDVNPDSKDIREDNWEASGKKLLGVMGNEQHGMSDEVEGHGR